MTIAQIECFLEIVNRGNITRAAEYLFITQQAASKHIRSIEKELGYTILERGRNGIVLTDEGKILYEEWSKMYEIYRISVDKAHDLHAGKEKTVRIGLADMGSVTEEMLSAFHEYEARYQDISIEYQLMSPREMYFAMESGELDVSICFESELKDFSGFRMLPLNDSNQEVGVFMAKNHPLARPEVTMGDLVHAPIGILSTGNSMDFELREHQCFAHYGLKYEGVFQPYDSRRSLEIALAAGRCVTIVYSRMFPTDNDKFFYKKMDLESLSSRISLFWKSDDTTTKARVLAEILQDHLN